MGRNRKWQDPLRSAQREANGEFRLYSDDKAWGCYVVRWITPEAGERMVRSYSARRVVNQNGDTVGYQLHRSFIAPKPVMITPV